MVVQNQSRAWCSRQLAAVDVKARSDSTDADIVVMRPAELPHFAAAGMLHAVPEPIRRAGAPFDWLGLLPVYREQLLVWDRIAYGLPLLGEAPVCCFREDWFKDAQKRKEFVAFQQARPVPAGSGLKELRAPASWEEFLDLAEFFRNHHPSGKPSPSLPPLPADAYGLDRFFYQVAAPFARRGVREDDHSLEEKPDQLFSFHFNLATGNARVGTQGFVAALNLMQRLQKCRPALVQPSPEQAFLDGKAAFCVTDAGWVAQFQKSPALRDRFGIAPIPGAERYFTFAEVEMKLKEGANRMPYLGGEGWLAVVPKSAANPEAAWDLLASMCGPSLSGQTALEPRWGGAPTRLEHLSRDHWEAFELDPVRTRALRDALAKTLQSGLKNPVVCLRIPNEEEYRKKMDAKVRDALKGGEAKINLQETARAWDEANNRDGGAAANLARYRISLGLLAR
jgi:multiple sugar transport system substrate-binding protein